MKVLVLCGPESSGKSWLAARIQARWGGRVVGEYVRYFIDRHARDTTYADIPAIAQGQMEWEDAARLAQPELLILDTHLLSNMLWSQALFDQCPAWLETALLQRRYDLHVLLSPDSVGWVADGQRCQPALADRLEFFAASRQWLDDHQQRYQVLSGDWAEREAQALALAGALLSGR